MDLNIINTLMIMLAGVFLIQGVIPGVWSRAETGLGVQFLRTLAHGDLIHLLANLFGLWKVRDIGKIFSLTEGAWMIFFIWIVSTLGLYSWNLIAGGSPKITIGFSGVLFGLFVVYYYLQSNNISAVLLTLLQGILPHLLMPGVSFHGHLSGILAGWLYVTLFL